jgi:octopine/nopaline transport system ATP-binding protein
MPFMTLLSDPIQLKNSAPIVVVKDLYKSFGNVKVLDGVSLTAQTGDVLALIGASGSGKSTLLRCLNLLEIPQAGHIYISGESLQLGMGLDGHPITPHARQVDRIRRRLGMVFQQFNLWPHMTVLENVTEVPVRVLKKSKAEAISMAEGLLEKVGMLQKRHAYPAFLSGGQQQRVAIARALATEPSVMLFDEPTSALDPELVGEVLKVIRDLALAGTTMLVVTHEMTFAREVANQVVFLHQGKIEEAGPSEQVFSSPRSERCRQFIGAQHRASYAVRHA